MQKEYKIPNHVPSGDRRRKLPNCARKCPGRIKDTEVCRFGLEKKQQTGYSAMQPGPKCKPGVLVLTWREA